MPFSNLSQESITLGDYIIFEQNIKVARLEKVSTSSLDVVCREVVISFIQSSCWRFPVNSNMWSMPIIHM